MIASVATGCSGLSFHSGVWRVVLRSGFWTRNRGWWCGACRETLAHDGEVSAAIFRIMGFCGKDPRWQMLFMEAQYAAEEGEDQDPY
jgi:hypothetical protein